MRVQSLTLVLCLLSSLLLSIGCSYQGQIPLLRVANSQSFKGLASPNLTWSNVTVASQSGVFTASFTAVPTTSAASGEDSVIGFSNGSASTYSSLAVNVRFGVNGIDAMNGSGYQTLKSLSYSPGTSYLVEFVINIPSHVFSVYVTPQGQSQVLIAQNFGFRTTQATVASLNNFASYSDIGGVTISNLQASPPPGVTSTVPWQSIAVASQNGSFTLQFDAVPNANAMDGVIGLSQNPPAGYGDLAANIRFNPTGTIDIMTSTGYQAATSVSYGAGKSYHFRLDVNIPAHTYSAYVTPAGGAQATLGTNVTFRATQSTVASLAHVAFEADVGSETISGVAVSNSIQPMPTPTPGPTSVPTPVPTPVPPTGSQNIFVSQTATGNGSGASCANSRPVGFFNSASNWGAGAGQISAGTIVHFCGTISSPLAVQGNGAVGNPVTIFFEINSKISMPLCPGRGTGCIYLTGKSNIVVDGGTNGIIENTGNGTGRQYASGSYGIEADSCTNCEIRNLTIQNLYVRTSTSDISIDQTAVRCVDFSGSNVSVHNNICHDAGWALTNGFKNGDGNISIYGNDVYNIDHGWVPVANAPGINIGAVYFYGNHIHDYANWDSGAADVYHHDGIHCFSTPVGTTGGHWSNVYVYNNRFDGNTGGNITGQIFLEGAGSGGTPCGDATSQFWIFNNVFTASQADNGIIWVATTTLNFFNNIVLGHSPSDSTCLSIHSNGKVKIQNNAVGGCNQLISASPTEIASLGDVDHNSYMDCTGSYNCFWVGTTDTASFTGYQSATGLDAHSTSNLSYVPLLELTGWPQTGSPLLGTGMNLSSLCSGALAPLCVDLGGHPRPTSGSWDAGSY